MHCKYRGKDGNKQKFKFNWIWNGRPFVMSTDTVAFAWDDKFRISSRDVSCDIRYSNGGWNYTRDFDDVEVKPGTGFRASFNMMDMPKKQNDAYAKQGIGYFKITNPKNLSDIQIVWKYGHSTFSFGGFCLNVGWSSISANKGTEVMDRGDKVFSLD
ncbi:hypothetical protein [Crassaminicella indica]|uniref:Uncharacterized protein n=1 Tax=Crassaminicella indica TaxID=2855394 RepID=A0ABX8R9L1_9CLOT|nr:hypothetical protein [Crassaminicella indica]QXM05491.1 hypothetical protein KVH43_08870 [Crassaminicella indica]